MIYVTLLGYTIFITFQTSYTKISYHLSITDLKPDSEVFDFCVCSLRSPKGSHTAPSSFANLKPVPTHIGAVTPEIHRTLYGALYE
jgi:hypothetical protein